MSDRDPAADLAAFAALVDAGTGTEAERTAIADRAAALRAAGVEAIEAHKRAAWAALRDDPYPGDEERHGDSED